MNNDNPEAEISLEPLNWKNAFTFLKLRHHLVNEADHLAVSGGERKETIFHIWARLFLHKGRSFVFIIRRDKEPIGYISLVLPRFRKLRGNMYIPAVLIRQSHRNLGLGTILMQKAEDFARSQKRRRLELEVFAKNEKAIKLYERLGYCIEGCKKSAVQTEDGFDDIVFMAKHLF